MITQQFAHLSELVEDIKATSDPAIAAIACRVLDDLLHNDPTQWEDEVNA